MAAAPAAETEATYAADCVLCPPLLFRFNEMAGLPGPPAVLERDRDFFLMPDLAPLADGHLLLVTAAHHACAGAFPPRMWAAARRWRDHVGDLYRRVYGSAAVLLMEHGPATPQGGGACIDHAHWHLLPGGRRVTPVLTARGLCPVPGGAAAAQALYAAGRSYLLVEENGECHAYPGDGAPGQFLRWAAATAIEGSPPAVWRWQEMFGQPPSRTRFLITLADLSRVARPSAARFQRPHVTES